MICKKPATESLSPVSDAGFKALGLIHLITAAEDFAADVRCSRTSDCDLMSINCGRGSVAFQSSKHVAVNHVVAVDYEIPLIWVTACIKERRTGITVLPIEIQM